MTVSFDRFDVGRTWSFRVVGGFLAVVAFVVGSIDPASAVVRKARFRMSLDSSSLTVGRNGSSSVTVLVTRLGSFEGPIKLSSSTRKGLKMVFDENPLEGDDTDLVATADGTATLGSTTLTVTGSDGRAAVKVRLKVKVTIGVPTTTVVATAATTVPAVAPSTSVSSPTTAPTATTAAPATSTTSTSTSAPTLPPAAVGDLIVARRVSQAVPCASALPVGTVAATVRVSFSNADASARVMSWVVPGTCAEVTPTTPFTLPASGLGSITIPFGSLVIARSAGTAGNPIRRVIAVTNSASLSFTVSSTANLAVQCSAGPALGGVLVPLADGQNYVLNNVPAGASCTVTGQYDTTPTRSMTDNSGITTDTIVQVPGRPAVCAIATTSTVLPGPAGCYAEFTHNS